ncbi:hypothetical protein KQX54_019218 [Cotesia glomerata]|uniref:Uncharacterized protein n=1 Tax=Cotesia glomerata TaxID=32391 RepID=A0AAV7I880_COTGL|nr:hypothetical protein KQX54_019218 [Cotesia glomerata]
MVNGIIIITLIRRIELEEFNQQNCYIPANSGLISKSTLVVVVRVKNRAEFIQGFAIGVRADCQKRLPGLLC